MSSGACVLTIFPKLRLSLYAPTTYTLPLPVVTKRLPTSDLGFSRPLGCFLENCLLWELEERREGAGPLRGQRAWFPVSFLTLMLLLCRGDPLLPALQSEPKQPLPAGTATLAHPTLPTAPHHLPLSGP